MLPIRPTSQFKKDLKRASRQGRNLDRLKQVLKKLAVPEPLKPEFKDRKLKGEWRDFRECHIDSDWLLIYTISDFELRPARLGSHSELFQ
ncbi:MAG: type II toxin-antitoxin system YafQ family toxin [Deltaproteobacteria bacterium]|nr:type II toxin-antitoxin system YafQ family toxin [Deltaproteobacteria bacterium]